MPIFSSEYVKNWVSKHGSGVAVIGIRVSNATEAYEKSTGKGEKDTTGWATGRTPPTVLKRDDEQGSLVVSEIFLYGDTILRFVEYRDGYNGAFLPGYKPYKDNTALNYGILKMDHVVGNVPDLDLVVNNINKWLGFHVFAFFTKEEIQTEWTSLNSTVMANNLETVLFPLNEPAKKKCESQITEYLKAYNGPGVQHIALFAPEVLSTIEAMRNASTGGFEFLPAPESYYEDDIVKKNNEGTSH